MNRDNDRSSQSPAGAPRLRSPERRQMELRAMSLDELIGDDHVARLVWAFTARFDYAPLLDAVAAREGSAGAPQTDPRLLVALWLYATTDGVGSARALARLCEHHHAYRWICGGVSVNHHTLSDFRTGHAEWLDAELARGVAGFLQAGAITLDSVAQDGLRVRASAGASSFRREPRLQDLHKLAQERVQQLKQQVQDDPAAQSARRQAATERAAAERLARVEAALAGLPEAQARKKRNNGDPARARVSTTDPQARVMKMPDGGFRPAYNVQLTAETELRLVVAVDVTTSGADQDALEPMQQRVASAYTQTPGHWLADGGYVSREGIDHMAACEIPFLAPIAPCMRQDKDNAAATAWRARMDSAAGKELFKLRGQTIEWVNAGFRRRGLYSVNVRGIAKVRAVALWHALANNIACMIHNPSLRHAAPA